MKDSVIEKILLHLYDCIDYGFSYRAKRGLWISKYFNHWENETSPKKIKDGIRNLNKQKFIKKKENYDGSVLISLTEKGMLRALNIIFRKLDNKKEEWDKKWRMIAFDIPEECRKGRNALRYRFRSAGFYEFQKSLFVYPYDCQKEVMALVKLFKLEKYVRFIVADFIDIEERLKFRYKLNYKLNR
jgi:DNA-binding transcriptional regulator PaaX